MAVIEELPGVEISILVNGAEAVEYDDPDGDRYDEDEHRERNVCRKYIESVDDAEFAISLGATSDVPIPRPFLRYLDIEIFIDGTPVGGVVSKKLGRHPCRQTFRGVEARSGSGDIRFAKFNFAPISTVDSSSQERVRRERKSTKHLGCIKVVVWRLLGMTPTSRKLGQIPAGSLQFSEKSLKGQAISHGTKFVDGGPASPRNYCRVNREDQPLAEFTFTYRSRDALKSELVIPRSPSPSSDQEFENLSDDAIRALARERFREQQARLKSELRPAVKREIGEAYDLTQDEPRRPYKVAKTQASKFVDLTED